jgi:hypothetical protein
VIGTPIRKLLHVLNVFVAAHHVLHVLYVAKGMRLDVVVLLLHVLNVLHVMGMRLDVVVLQLYVLYVLYVSERVALDVYLFFGSLAILILHSVLLSHHGFRSTFKRRRSYEESSLLLVKADQTLRSLAR